MLVTLSGMVTLVKPVQSCKRTIPNAYHRHTVYGSWDYNISPSTGISGDCYSVI